MSTTSGPGNARSAAATVVPELGDQAATSRGASVLAAVTARRKAADATAGVTSAPMVGDRMNSPPPVRANARPSSAQRSSVAPETTSAAVSPTWVGTTGTRQLTRVSAPPSSRVRVAAARAISSQVPEGRSATTTSGTRWRWRARL